MKETKNQQKPVEYPVDLGPRELGNWIENYLAYTEGTESPQEFHLWTAISVISGALGRKCWLDMGSFSIHPSFYIIFVAPPGVATKSTTAGIGIKMLRAANACDIFQGSTTWQAILDSLLDAGKQVNIKGQLLEMSNIHVFASELGTLLRRDDTAMVDMLVDLWDGKDKIERRTRAAGLIEIARPMMNLIGCTTPAWLNDYAQSYMIDGGFFSRAVFVYGDKKSKLIAYPTGFHDVELRTALENDLKRIAQLRGEFIMTQEAISFGVAWYDQTWNKTPAHIAGDSFASYRARRQAHLHKVAMVVSAAKRGDMQITLEDMEMANALLLASEKTLLKVNEAIQSTDKTAPLKMICNLIRGHKKGIRKQDLFQQLAYRISMTEFEQGIQAAIFAGFCKQAQVANEFVLIPKDI